MENIYFRYVQPGFVETLSTPWVSLEVDPSTAFVYNQEFRAKLDGSSYQASKMLLTSYLEKLERGERLREGRPPLTHVRFNPWSAEPVLVKDNDPRARDNLWLYLNEVPIAKSGILPNEFKRFSRKR